MERQDLMNALRLVMDYCISRENENNCNRSDLCTGCLIETECRMYFETANPDDWDLDDDK